MRSVYKALRHVGAEVEVFTKPAGLSAARAAVLPGVGAFDDCLTSLRRQELLDAAREFIQSGRPFLGICVGYQALFEASEEFNSCAAGMGLFAGRVVRFTSRPGHKIPQIGWNPVDVVKPDCPLFRGIPSGSHFYFVHSFFPRPVDDSIVAGRTEYGDVFASAIWSGNVYATQFHPEKSQRVGVQLLQNFVNLA